MRTHLAVVASLLIGSAFVSEARTGPATPATWSIDTWAFALDDIGVPAGTKGLLTLASLRPRTTTIRWLAEPIRQNAVSWQIGSVAGGEVVVAKLRDPSEIIFRYRAPSGAALNLRPPETLRARGFKIQVLYCSSRDSDGENYFLLTMPSKRPALLTVYAFETPGSSFNVTWMLSYGLDGRVPSLAAVHALGDRAATTDCSGDRFGPVEQISHAQALAIVARATAGR